MSLQYTHTCTQCYYLGSVFLGSPPRSSSSSSPGGRRGPWSGCTAAWARRLPQEVWIAQRCWLTALRKRHRSAPAEARPAQLVGEGAVEDVSSRGRRQKPQPLALLTTKHRNRIAQWEELFWASRFHFCTEGESWTHFKPQLDVELSLLTHQCKRQTTALENTLLLQLLMLEPYRWRLSNN